MTKTFADLTPEQRRDYVGMWCLAKNGLQYVRGIIRSVYEVEPDGSVDVLLPRTNECPRGNALLNGRYFDEVVPLIDYPRAWEPNGEPRREYPGVAK